MVIISWDISAITNVITMASDQWTVITLSAEYRHTKGEALNLAWNLEYSKLFTLECKNVNRLMTSLSMFGHKELIYFFFTRKRKNKISFYHSVQPRQVTPWSRCMLSQPTYTCSSTTHGEPNILYHNRLSNKVWYLPKLRDWSLMGISTPT